MTDEEAKRMLARMEALAAEVETLRREVASARRTAEDTAAEKEDSPDFGGGGEPDWSGAMGKVPDGMVENPAIPPLPDTTAAKDPNRLQYKSLDDRAQDCAPPGVTQIHDFDEALSNVRRVQLRVITRTGTGAGRFLQLVDPDGNADFQTKWMLLLREAGTGGREARWACLGGEVDIEAEAFGDAYRKLIEDKPDDYDPKQPEGYKPNDPDPYDPTVPDPIYVPVPDPNYDPDDPDHDRPFMYLRLDGLFWLRGGSAATNYGTSFKLGNANIGYITVSATL